MSNPTISVVMPVYNTGSYLHDSINSILQQTFTDFEFIIINDGSTDNSEEIILSYKDPRIRYYKNEKNEGLIFSLNRGLEIAKGKYIARLDGDDICSSQRLEKQKEWLENNTTFAVVGSTITFIDEHSNKIGEWKLDQLTTSPAAIKRAMAKENCLAHPSTMIRSELIKKMQYAPYQKHTEDYDLWLRILADGGLIAKMPEKLLLYRVHKTSITGTVLRQSNPFFVQYRCKNRFLYHRLKVGKWGFFETQVLLGMMYDGIMGIGKSIKNIWNFK
jgi:glycosyltransferase involved in cell wall biosynthesis